MTRGNSSYHREMAATNRDSILAAATQLFLESGYDRTSLARVAEHAGVSTATLFKQFPSKAELFEAAVLAVGGMPAPEPIEPPRGDFQAGLVVLGHAYAELLTRPQMVDLMRTVIAESPKFPELRERTFDFGTLPVLEALGSYLRDAQSAGTADIGDPDMVSAQFLAMIASAIFWPRFMHGTWSITEDEQTRVVEEAARTVAARCAR